MPATHPTHPQAAVEWLAAADPDPDHAERWWAAQGVALLPLGTNWEVVRVISRDSRTLAECANVEGPVIHDPRGHAVYFLVPLGTARTWRMPGTECLSTACYLAVPALSRVTGARGPYWLQPPDGSGRLVDPETLASALTRRDPRGAIR